MDDDVVVTVMLTGAEAYNMRDESAIGPSGWGKRIKTALIAQYPVTPSEPKGEWFSGLVRATGHRLVLRVSQPNRWTTFLGTVRTWEKTCLVYTDIRPLDLDAAPMTPAERELCEAALRREKLELPALNEEDVAAWSAACRRSYEAVAALVVERAGTPTKETP